MTHPVEFSDTDPRAMEVWLDLQRRMPAGEKLAATLKAGEFLLKTWESEVRDEHPRASDAEVRFRVAARHLPRDLMIQVYGWDPHPYGILDPAGDSFGDLPFGGQCVDMAYVREWAAQCNVTERLNGMIDE